LPPDELPPPELLLELELEVELPPLEEELELLDELDEELLLELELLDKRERSGRLYVPRLVDKETVASRVLARTVAGDMVLSVDQISAKIPAISGADADVPAQFR